MKITKLTKRLGRVIGLKNFSSVTFQEECAVELDSKDDSKVAEQKLYDFTAYMLHKDIQRWKDGIKSAKEDKE